MNETQTRSVDRRRLLQIAGTTGALGIVAGGLGGKVLGNDAVSSDGPASKDDIVIGALYPMTGPSAADGAEMTNGSDLAVSQINAAGGVLGRKLKKVVLDTDVSAPESIVTNYQKLASRGVDAVIVGYLIASEASLDIAAKYGAPYLNASTTSAQVAKIQSDPRYGNIFQIDPSEVVYGRGIPRFLDSAGQSGWAPEGKSIHIIASNDPYGQVISKETQKAAVEAGYTIAKVTNITPPISNWTPQIQEIQAAAADVIVVTYYLPSALASFMKAYAANPTGALVYLQYGPSVPEFLSLAGDAANGVVWSTVTGVYPDDIGTAFAEQYQEAYGKAAGFSNSGTGYDEVYLLADAWGRAGGTRDFKAVSEALRNGFHRGVNGAYYLRNNVGLSYPNETEDPSLGQAHLFFQIQNEEQKVVYPAPYANAALTKPSWVS